MCAFSVGNKSESLDVRMSLDVDAIRWAETFPFPSKQARGLARVNVAPLLLGLMWFGALHPYRLRKSEDCVAKSVVSCCVREEGSDSEGGREGWLRR